MLKVLKTKWALGPEIDYKNPTLYKIHKLLYPISHRWWMSQIKYSDTNFPIMYFQLKGKKVSQKKKKRAYSPQESKSPIKLGVASNSSYASWNLTNVVIKQ